MLRAIFLLALLLPSVNAIAEDFPRPPSLEAAVRFWIKVYTEISTGQGYIHDAETLSVVYQKLNLPAAAGSSDREQLVAGTKQRISSALSSLGKGKRTGLDPTEAAVLAAWPVGTSSGTFATAAENVRFQRGQSDRFKEGLIRSGQWKPYIRRVLAKHRLPRELEVLPHVESSFNPSAYSKAAAAGMWQFMPATARQFIRVDHVLDERMDPFTATEAAAKLLQRNYDITGAWPLALTGYNHGAGGVMRAVEAVGSTDIAVIVQRYKGTAFGFASRNFYASFLAALEIDKHPERYFGPVKLDSPIRYEVVSTEKYIPASKLARAVSVSLDELRQHNPALLEPVWTGEKYIPRGYAVRVPSAQLEKPLKHALAVLPGKAQFENQKPDFTHRIARGESLSVIARRYDTSVAKLMALNGLRHASIQVGQKLRLPGNATPQLAPARQLIAKVRKPSKAGSGADEYVIQQGDTLWSIARRFNVSRQELLSWNGISPKEYIQPGQKLKISNAG